MSVSRIGDFFFESTAGGDKRKRISSDHPGLKNPSNFCFANALVQCLTVFEPFQYLPANSDNVTVSNLKLLIDGLKRSDFVGDSQVRDLLASITLHEVGHLQYDATKKNYKISIREKKHHIRQNDPGELFSLIFRECEPNPIFTPGILLISLSKIECQAPVYTNSYGKVIRPYTSIREDAVGLITIPMYDQPIDIGNFIAMEDAELIESEFDDSVVENDSTLLSIICPIYKRGEENHKKSISYLPTVNTKGVAIYINRNESGMKKTTPLEISDRITFQNEMEFKLVAFLCHEGHSNRSGHYIAYAQRDDRWYEFNDNKVTEMPNINLGDFFQKVTMLFYNR